VVLGAAGLVWAFFSRRAQSFDDLGLFNPPYMYLHYGVVTYPAHGQFDSMTVHPPTHYWILGMLMKVGLEPFYAEAVPPLVFLFVAIWLIASSEWSTTIKAGLLVGLSVPFLSVGGFIPRMRPETHLSLAWYAALLALESARMKGWASGRLLLGSTLLTYASTLHYPIAPACLGVVVYVVWVVRDRRLRRRSRQLAALLGGSLIVGAAYLGFFVVPHWYEIVESIKIADRTGGPVTSIREHVRTYAAIYDGLNSNVPRFVLLPLHVGVPVILIAAGILVASRETRGLAISSLPYPIFLLLGVGHKYFQTGYYMPELILYYASIGVAICVIAHLSVQVFMAKRQTVRVLAPIAGAGLLVATLGTAGVFASVGLSTLTNPQRHEATVARAAGRSILGGNVLLGSRNAIMFYASGATHYFDVAPDLLRMPKPTDDLPGYFAGFDALVEFPSFSHWTWNENRESLVSWYLKRLLRLRGFYLSATNDELSYLLLNTASANTTQGYGRLADGSVVRFLEGSDGAYRFVALRCDGDPVGSLNIGEILRADYGLPGMTPAKPSGWLTTFVIPAKDLEDSRSSLPPRCLVHQEIPLRLERVEPTWLSKALAADPPIRFFADRESAMEVRHGPEMVVQVNEEGWADVVQFVRGPKVGRVYHLAPEQGRVLFRASGALQDVWRVHRYGARGGLEPRAVGLGQGNRILAYSGNDPRDHLATPFLEALADQRSLVLFTMWVKNEGKTRPPLVYLQDDHFFRLATARPVRQTSDGWRLLAGSWVARPGDKLRLVVAHQGRGACLLDKAIISTVPE
jgi:hypothetical protein